MTTAQKFVPDWNTTDVYVSRDGTEWRFLTLHTSPNSFVSLENAELGSRNFEISGEYCGPRNQDRDIVRQYTPAAAPPEVPQWCVEAFAELRDRGYFNYSHHSESITGKEIIAIIARHAPQPDAKEVAVLESMLANEERACMEVLKERDTAIGFCDLFAATILGEDINWSCHETKWQEAWDMFNDGKEVIRELIDPQPATETADEREANLSTKQVERMLAESWKIIKNAEGNALPASPATVAASSVERWTIGTNVCGWTAEKDSHGDYVEYADHDRLLAERDAEIAELREKLADEERRGDLHADLNKRVAEAIGNPFTGPGSSWHDLPEKVANLKSEYEYQRDAVMRGIEHCKSFSERLTAATTRAEAAEAKCAEYRDTFTATNEMRLSEVRLRHAVQQRAELAELHCTAALDRLEVANAQLAELRAANERMRERSARMEKLLRGYRGWFERSGSIQVNQKSELYEIDAALAAAETGVGK